jgi:hypothetical protein
MSKNKNFTEEEIKKIEKGRIEVSAQTLFERKINIDKISVEIANAQTKYNNIKNTNNINDIIKVQNNITGLNRTLGQLRRKSVKQIETETDPQIKERAKELLTAYEKPWKEAAIKIEKYRIKQMEDPQWYKKEKARREKAKNEDPDWIIKQNIADRLKGLTNEKKKTLNDERIKENNETYEKLAHFARMDGVTPGLGEIPNLERGTKLLVNRLHKSGNIESIEIIAEARKQKILERMKLINAKMNEKNISVGGPIRTNTNTTTPYHPYQSTDSTNTSSQPRTLVETNTSSQPRTLVETNTSSQPRTLVETKDKILKRQQIQQIQQKK